MSTRSDRQRQARTHARSGRRPTAGEYGEGPPEQDTGVGPRSGHGPAQRLDTRGGPPDPYGAVAPGRYGVHGYSGARGDPGTYPVDEQGQPVAPRGAARAKRRGLSARGARRDETKK